MIRDNIHQMSAYRPPLEGRSAGDYLLLDFNERTTPVSAHVRQALIEYVNCNRLHQYPEYGDFVERLADYTEVSPSRIMITNGSDQGIDLIYRLVATPGDEAIVPAPTFAMLSHCALVADMQLLEPTYTDNFLYPLDKVLSLVGERTRVIVVCNPNSPTGTLLQTQDVLRIAKAAPQAAILVDECYFEYAGETVKDFLGEYPNLFITRTFSKTWGLPSLRLGYLMSAEENIDNLLKIRGPYDINRMAIVAAQAALEDPSYMRQYVDELLKVSLPTFLEFLERRAIRYWPTSANFVLFYPKNSQALLAGLQAAGILARPRSGPGIEGTVRVNLGTPAQTERLISVLDRLL